MISSRTMAITHGWSVLGCCQTDSNQSHFPRKRRNLGETELTPPGENSVADQLEVCPGVEVVLLVEMVRDGRENGRKFLQTAHAPEGLHCPLAPSEWKV